MMLKFFSGLLPKLLILVLFISGPCSFISFGKDILTAAKDTVQPIPSQTFFISNKGSNTNDGHSTSTPKLSLNSISPLLVPGQDDRSGPAVLLETNSIFREEFTPVKNTVVSLFEKNPGGGHPKITGMDIISDWKPTLAKAGVFEKLLTHGIDLASPKYAYIIVAEIDTISEKFNAVKAVKYLRLAASLESCQAIPGSYFVQDVTVNPIMVYIHPTEGAPGSNKFRYEATTRRYAINGYETDGAKFSDLFLQSSGTGYGLLGGGDNTEITNMIFQGGGTHHLVIKSGTIDSSIFFPGPTGLKDRIAAVFYEAEGKGNVNRISNTLFFDIYDPIYTHTNGADSHHKLTIDKVYAFADPTDALNGLSSYDTDSVLVSNSYVENYPTGWYGASPFTKISKSVFRNTNQSAIQILQPKELKSNVSIDNVLIKTNGNDGNQNGPNGWVAYGVRAAYPNTDVTMVNSIIHGYSTWHQSDQASVYAFQIGGQLVASRNIYICDINDNNLMNMGQADNSGGMGTSANVKSDYNVFIVLRGRGFHWSVKPNNENESNVLTLAKWQEYTGQDKHSLYIDLRNNPLGLRAIFEDPDHGNWSLAASELGRAVKSIEAGMTDPLLFYPQRPVIMSGSPVYLTPGGFSSFKGSASSPNESLLQWKTFFDRDFSQFAIEQSLDSLSFTTLDTISATGNGLENSYRYVHSHSEIPKLFYRLKILKKDGSVDYSAVITVTTTSREGVFLQVYPNPFQQIISVNHPNRSNATIGLYNLNGMLIKQFNIRPGIVESKLSLGTIRQGSYVLRWSAGNESAATMIVK